MYQIVITPSAKRSSKKMPRYIREAFVKQLQRLKKDPYTGERLSQPLSFLYSFHFKFKNVHYRAVYTIDTKAKQIIIHLTGPREGFYNRMRRLFR
ncbi:hypothetical protein CL633_03410 [bacterium]|nr:hypothetical protein [bacterium]|tara:strand:+ start:12551 stop:12835 length:285 start_codon:yes stop_codon:yes gene_type:complete